MRNQINLSNNKPPFQTFQSKNLQPPLIQKNISSQPPSVRSLDNFLLDQQTPRSLLLKASQFQDSKQIDENVEISKGDILQSPLALPSQSSQFDTNLNNNQCNNNFQEKGQFDKNMTMMDRLRQNRNRMINFFPNLQQLNLDYSMEDLCYLLMDQQELLIQKVEELFQQNDQEYLSQLNRRIIQESQDLRNQVKSQVREQLNELNMLRRIQELNKQVQKLKGVIAKTGGGVNIDKKIAQLQRKDKQQIQNLKFLQDQNNQSIILKNDEIKKLKKDLQYFMKDKKDLIQSETAPLINQIQKQKEYITHINKRLSEVINSSKVEFSIFQNKSLFGGGDSSLKSIDGFEQNQKNIKKLLNTEYQRDQLLFLHMNQAKTIQKLLKSSTMNFGTLGGRISNAYDTLRMDSVFSRQGRAASPNQNNLDQILLTNSSPERRYTNFSQGNNNEEEDNNNAFSNVARQREVLQGMINSVIEKQNNLSSQYKGVLDILYDLTKEISQQQDKQQQNGRDLILLDQNFEQKSQQLQGSVPDKNQNPFAYMQHIDSLFKEGKFQFAAYLWKKVNYDPLTHISPQRNSQLLKIVIKLRERSLSKAQQTIQNYKQQDKGQQYIKVRNNYAQNLDSNQFQQQKKDQQIIEDQYLVRNDSAFTPNQNDSRSRAASFTHQQLQMKQKINDLENLKSQYQVLVRKKSQKINGMNNSTISLQKILLAKMQEKEKDLDVILGNAPRFSSRDTLLSINGDNDCSNKKLIQQNKQLKSQVQKMNEQKLSVKLLQQQASKKEMLNIGVLNNIFITLGNLTDTLTSGRNALNITDTGDDTSLIQRTSTASQIAKRGGQSSKLNTNNLLRQLFCIIGEVQKLTNQLVLHLKLNQVKKTDRNNIFFNNTSVASPLHSMPSSPMFHSPISCKPAIQESMLLETPSQFKNQKATTQRASSSQNRVHFPNSNAYLSHIFNSDEKSAPSFPQKFEKQYTNHIKITKQKARRIYQLFLEDDLKIPSTPDINHLKQSKSSFFNLYQQFGSMTKNSQSLLLELSIATQKLSLLDNSAKQNIDLTAKLKDCEDQLTEWKSRYLNNNSTSSPNSPNRKISAAQSVQNDYLHQRINLLQKRSDTLTEENQGLGVKLAQKDQKIYEAQQSQLKLSQQIKFKDQRIKNLEILTESIKQEMEDMRQIQRQIDQRIQKRGLGAKMENDLKRIVQLQRQRNKLKREYDKISHQNKNYIEEINELKEENNELSKEKLLMSNQFQIFRSRTPHIADNLDTQEQASLQNINQNMGSTNKKFPGSQSVANTTDVLRQNASFFASERQSQFPVSPLAKSRSNTIQSTKFPQRQSIKIVSKQNQKEDESKQVLQAKVKTLQQTIEEYEEILKSQRQHANNQKSSIKQQLYNAVSQLQQQQSSIQDRQDYADLYYALTDQIHKINFTLFKESPRNRGNDLSSANSTRHMVGHIIQGIEDLQKKYISQQQIINKAVHQQPTKSNYSQARINQIQLLREQNKLLRERMQAQLKNIQNLQKDNDELSQVIDQIDLNKDEIAKEYMRQLIVFLQEHGMEEGLPIQNVTVKDLLQRSIKLISKLKEQIQNSMRQINDTKMTLGKLKKAGIITDSGGGLLGLSFDQLRNLVKEDKKEKELSLHISKQQNDINQLKEQNSKLSQSLSHLQKSQKIQALKSRNLLLHYAQEIDRERKQKDQMRQQLESLNKFKQKTSNELLMLISRLRQQKQIQKSMSGQLELLTNQLRQIQGSTYTSRDIDQDIGSYYQ